MSDNAIKQTAAAEALGGTSSGNGEHLKRAMKVHWGYDGFKPLQYEAMDAVLNNKDSLVVFPTGGGKSLCFQVPAVVLGGLGVVVSPLISLMKDQVDALRENGIRAAYLNSSLTGEQENEILEQVANKSLSLLYVAPERLASQRTQQFLSRTGSVKFFAVDEAHCLSQWGHDFRPEYRELIVLRKLFPDASFHAYTATATERVRQDIITELGMESQRVLVGSMDRPNLNYQIRRREKGVGQIVDVIKKHEKMSGIVYCITRKEVESTCNQLCENGILAKPYHAGLDFSERQQTQDDFLQEKVDVIVATVAFGMGIDKSNVRYVIHSGMPKSLEAYQQESGRAGRDGLPAECWLFHKAADYMSWSRIIQMSPSEDANEIALNSLREIDRFCKDVKCRHQSLVNHFGEKLETKNCNACDICLDNIELVDDGLVLAQKIISCVYRTNQSFGASYISKVLHGANDKKIVSNFHDKVSTYGLLSKEAREDIRIWVEQLVGQSFLAKEGEYNVLKITDAGREVLRGEVTPLLTKANQANRSRSNSRTRRRDELDSLTELEQGLFGVLREIRRQEALDKSVPAYHIFGDASLIAMSVQRPSTLDDFQKINGVGRRKLEKYGQIFADAIIAFCGEKGCETDVARKFEKQIPGESKKMNVAINSGAFALFESGMTTEEVAKNLCRATSTVESYLACYLRNEKITDPSKWVDQRTAKLIKSAGDACGWEYLKPIFLKLDEKVPYGEIKIVKQCLRNERFNEKGRVESAVDEVGAAPSPSIEVSDFDKKKESFDRRYWAAKSSVEALEVVDSILSFINSSSEKSQSLAFRKYYIAALPGRLVTFKPVGRTVMVTLKLDDASGWVSQFSNCGMSAKVCVRRGGKLRVEVTAECVDKFFDQLKQAMPELLSKSNSIYEKFIPINDSKALKVSRYADATESTLKRWGIFKNKVCRTPFMKKKLLVEQGNACPICRKPINASEGIVHHVDYDHLCVYDHTVILPAGKNGESIRVANCANCNVVGECSKRLVLLHGGCHFRVHLVEGRVRKERESTKDRDYWVGKTSKESMVLVDEVQRKISDLVGVNIGLVFHELFIGVERYTSFAIKPMENSILISLNLKNPQVWFELLSKSDLQVSITRRSKRLRVEFDQVSFGKYAIMFDQVLAEALGVNCSK